MAVTSNLYTSFNFTNDEDAIFNSKESVSIATWSNNETELTNFYYYSTKTNRDYFVNVYNTDPLTDDEAEIQFSVSFGNYYGCATPLIDASFDDDMTPSKAIYHNIKNTIDQNENDKIIFDSTEYDRIYALSVRKERLHDRVKSGSVFLHLNDYGTDLYMIDDISIVNRKTTIYNIIRANSDGTEHATPTVIGKMYIDKGLIILNADTIETLFGSSIFSNCGLNVNCSGFTCDGDSDGYADVNPNTLFIDMMQSFIMISEQYTSSIIYFIRVNHTNFNHSNNPTFVQNEQGDLLYTEMVDNPFTYITTIGLYNEGNELLAVARVSQPILKTYEREALIRVKLTF